MDEEGMRLFQRQPHHWNTTSLIASASKRSWHTSKPGFTRACSRRLAPKPALSIALAAILVSHYGRSPWHYISVEQLSATTSVRPTNAEKIPPRVVQASIRTRCDQAIVMAEERSAARDGRSVDLYSNSQQTVVGFLVASDLEYNAGRLEWTAAGKISASWVHQLDIGSMYLCQIAAGPCE
jgi:hypothetical protein